MHKYVFRKYYIVPVIIKYFLYILINNIIYYNLILVYFNMN
jgi:hypothetical protein